MTSSVKISFLHLLMTASLFSPTECALSADPQTGVSLVINELMASNSSTIQDPEGQYDDWIEIHNFGSDAVNVGGMYVTDDLTDPTQWQIPTDRSADTTIPAHGYLLIWADEDTSDAGLHANFKLDAMGEELGLFATSTSGMGGVTLIDHVVFGEQAAETSYGRDPDASSNLTFLISPTPGAKNTVGYLGRVNEPEFSHQHGFFDEPFSIAITTETEGATIYYTLDGSEPDATEMRRSLSIGIPYTHPILIDKTACLRAKAVKDGWKPSETIACSYIFLDDVMQQPAHPEGFPDRWGSRNADYEMDPEVVNDARYHDHMKTALTAIPTVSIVMNNNDMFGNEGIYSNPRQDWEKPASVELIYPNGTQQGFQVNCGIKIIGGASRNMSLKNSFRLLFKGIYGPTRLRYSLFGRDAASEFNTIVLRSSFNDGYGWSGARSYEQYARDEFIRTLQQHMGHVSPHSIPAHLYVNGLYWGLYFPCERPDASFSASYYGGDEEDWDTFSHTGITLREGNDSAYHQMIALCQQASHSDEAYQQLQGDTPDGSRNPEYPCLLDVTNYIDYLLLNYCVNNEDWPWNNYWFARKRTADSTGFKFYSWDSEISLYLPPRAHMGLNRTTDFRNVGQVHGYLVQNDDYRLFFGDRVHHHLFNHGVLTPEYMSRLYLDIADQVEMPVICESARWGDMHHEPALNQDDWYDMRDWLLENFFEQRHDIVVRQLKNAGLYPEAETPTFYVDDAHQHGGHVNQSARLTMESPSSGTVYYTLDGSDPRQTGTGSQRGASTQLVTENAAKKVLVPIGTISGDWKGSLPFDDSTWISGTGGVGYERSTGYEQFFSIDVQDQMYGRNATCYIRIPFDLPAESIDDLTSLRLKVRYDDGFVAYLNGVEVQRASFNGNSSWNSSASMNRSDVEAINLEMFDISGYADQVRAGENILAIQGLNESTTSSDFLISAELTAMEGPGGGTPSGVSPGALRYIGPVSLNGSTHVKARLLSGSTWSALNEATFAVGPVAENLRITEIMYHPQETGDPNDPNEEFLELTNIGAETLSLNLVTFTNGIDFTFPDIDLAAGQYVVVVKDPQAFSTRYGTDSRIAGQYSGRLANGGERIRLEDAVGQTILDFEYSDDWYDDTDGKGYSLTIIDAANPDPNSWSQKQSWRISAYRGGSPD